MKSWIEVREGSDFPLLNIPFGIVSVGGGEKLVATIIGETVIDLAALANRGYLSDLAPAAVFQQEYLNEFIGLSTNVRRAVRERIIGIFAGDSPQLRDNADDKALILHPLSDVTNHLPVRIGDYTDFYSSREHATNVGIMFRDPANALLPNWKHIPVGYHGRASSIVVSGTDIHRPKGQTMPEGATSPVFGPSKQFDFELEMAFVVGRNNELGVPVPIHEAEDHIFGLALFNDLSARDIQKWEYVPLGPFLSKNFGSVMSPWIVTMEALEPFRVSGPEQDTPVLDYLRHDKPAAFDIQLDVGIAPAGSAETRVCLSNFRYLYWSMAQQLAHHTVNGCNMKVGDLCASGTISGPAPDSYGSMLELAWKGTRPLAMADGTQRTFIHDGDTIIMRAWAEKTGLRVGFGEVRTTVLPVLD